MNIRKKINRQFGTGYYAKDLDIKYTEYIMK